MRQVAVLPLVPVEHVEDVWLQALDENNDENIQVERFTDCVTETWIDGRPLAKWNDFNDDDFRATNHADE